MLDIRQAQLDRQGRDGAEKETGRELNYSALSPEEYDYRISLNDRFITNLLEAKKIVIIDGPEGQPARTDTNFGEFLGGVALDVEAVPVRLRAASGRGRLTN